MDFGYILLGMNSVLQTGLLIIGALLGLGVVVFVHELGHFITARRTGITVEVFSIGFGPRIWHKEVNGVDYRICAIFFGGYVKLAGMTGEDDVPAHKVPGGFFAAKPGKRSLTAFAGAGMNLIFAFLVFTLLWGTGKVVDKSELSTVVGIVEPDSRAAEAGITPGDKLIRIDGREIKEWKDVLLAVAFSKDEVIPIIFQRDAKEMSAEFRPKIDKDMGARIIDIVQERPVIVNRVTRNTIAEKSGLQKDDRITAVVVGDETTPIHHIYTFREKLKKYIGHKISVRVLRDGESVTLSAVVPEPKKGDEYPMLGFELGFEKVLTRTDPLTASWEVIEMVYKTLSSLFKGSVKAKALAGPVGIINIIGLYLLSHWTRFLHMLAFISFNLAIVNLLPIPVLDGGHILFSLVEAVRKKPASEKVMNVVTNVFAGLIILFFLYVTSNDIMRMFNIGQEKREESPKKEQTIEEKENQDRDLAPQEKIEEENTSDFTNVSG